MTTRNEQEEFWADDYALDYIRKNSDFDLALGKEAWQKMLARADKPQSILECGCNIGRNTRVLLDLLPTTAMSVIEISKPAYSHVTATYPLKSAFNGSILDSSFTAETFDLVFTIGVVIHIHPDQLLANMRNMFEYSKKYILIGEYFNRTPVMLEYQGQANKLFKQDFGKLFLQNHRVKLVDYGFLWGHIYDQAGFDDITWWLFEKEQLHS